MVSLRRRRLLGYHTGCIPYPMLFDDEGVAYFPTPPGTPEDQPICPDELETRGSSTKASSPKKLGSSSSANQTDQTNGDGSTSAKKQLDLSSPDDGMNPRKKNKRKHTKEQEKTALRGVYFKNMKWQAAIKVDKRQIHLGTFGSQAEAARQYDRAAFMCGRSPNFELPEGDIEELRKLKWEQFLTKTRDDITFKRSVRKQTAARSPNKSDTSAPKHGAKRALDFSEDPELEGSAS